MWSILGSLISTILGFFLGKKQDSDKEAREVVNTGSRTASEISRSNQNETDQKLEQVSKDNDSLASTVNSGSVSAGSDSINEAIRRANGKTNR